MLESKVLKFMVKISSTVEVNSVYKLGFPELCSWFLQIPWLWWLDQDVTCGMYEQRVGECEAAGGARTCLRLRFTAWTLWISCFWLDESWCSKWKNLRILQSCSWLMRRWCERNKSTQLSTFVDKQLLLFSREGQEFHHEETFYRVSGKKLWYSMIRNVLWLGWCVQ